MDEYNVFQKSNFVSTSKNLICKNCKYNRNDPASAFCDKYRAGGFESKPGEVVFAEGKGKCKYFKAK